MNRLFLITLGIFVLAGTIACQKQPTATGDTAATDPDAAEAPPAKDSSESSAARSSSELPLLGEAPTWTLNRMDGTSLSSADLAGKVVVVDFWATWCPPCRAEIPGYVAMQDELRDQGVVILGISLDEGGPAVVKPFAERFGINYELVMADRNITDAFGGVRVIPTTFLIDRDGQVRHRKEGMMEREDYEPLVRSLL